MIHSNQVARQHWHYVSTIVGSTILSSKCIYKIWIVYCLNYTEKMFYKEKGDLENSKCDPRPISWMCDIKCNNHLLFFSSLCIKWLLMRQFFNEDHIIRHMNTHLVSEYNWRHHTDITYSISWISKWYMQVHMYVHVCESQMVIWQFQVSFIPEVLASIFLLLFSLCCFILLLFILF